MFDLNTKYIFNFFILATFFLIVFSLIFYNFKKPNHKLISFIHKIFVVFIQCILVLKGIIVISLIICYFFDLSIYTIYISIILFFNKNHIFSLNSIWLSLGLTDISFLGFFKIIFFILFLVLNIVLVYLEYLENKYTKKYNTVPHIQSGVSPELKRIAKHLIISLGVVSSLITVKSEFKDPAKEAEKAARITQKAEEALAKAEDETKKVAVGKVANNFVHKLQIHSIKGSYSGWEGNQQEQSELYKALEANKDAWKNDGDVKHLEKNKIVEVKIQGLKIQERRHMADLKANINKASRFSEELSKETDENKVLEMISDEIKKSSIFDLEELWTNFETLNGISKIVITMLFANYFILSSVFSLIIIYYGNYLINRFNLEDKYPKIAMFIKYRKTVSNYYILSNFIFIILMCLSNVILGVSVLSVIYT